jgi:hypothetical protein
MLRRGQLFGKFPVPPGPVGFLDGVRIKSIQRGHTTGTMTGQYNSTVTVTISSVDLSKAVLIIAGVEVNGGRPGFKAKLTSSTSFEVEVCNYNNSYDDYDFYWAVVEFENATVQRGEITQSVASGVKATGTVTVNSVPLDRSFLVFGGYYINASTTVLPSAAIAHTAEDTLTYQMYQTTGSTQNVVMPWQLVTLNN